MLLTIGSFLAILGVLVLVHELGHFFVARHYGVLVDELGLGFPPRIFGWYRDRATRRWHLVGRLAARAPATIYSLNWVPLGGFVKIKGEQGDFDADPDSFSHQRVRHRLAILVAGVAMNLGLAVGLLTVGFALGLPQVLTDQTPRGAQVSDLKIQVVEVVANLPAARAGLRVGDRLLSLDGQTFSTLPAVQAYVNERSGNPVRVTVERDGERRTAAIVPTRLPGSNQSGLGVGLVRTGLVRYAPHRAVGMGISTSLTLTYDIVSAVGGMVTDLVARKPVSLDLSGPVGIAAISGQVARLGWRYLLQFVALLSLNLALVNILPLPALDGGRAAFVLLERFRGRAVNARAEAMIHQLGFILLLVLVMVITYRDIAQLFSRAGMG